jgi:ubiquinone/menaquinone biosynthesis C-methylase UbiE
MLMTKKLSSLFWYPFSSKNKIEKYQEHIRQLEWNAIYPFIPMKSSFIDVGCGAGYSLMKAKIELNCDIKGIDPEPGAHGVGRYTSDDWKNLPIIKGSAENLPFENDSFDVVYSSHVLEHVKSEEQTLDEMKRVLKPGGVLIIGMPTATMSMIALFSSWFFTTHINIYHFIRSMGQKTAFKNFIRIFIPPSHSFPRAKYITYDLNHYRISNWRKTLSKTFKIEKIITPGLYPYPDYIQWFPLLKIGRLSSSVFFICKIKD